MTNRPFNKKWLAIPSVLLIGFIALQFIHPTVSNPPVTGDYEAPSEVKSIIKRACYDCHSNETHLRWYDKIVPVYWMVASHVKDGRSGLNFSQWKSLAPYEQKAKLWEAVNQVIAGAMPVKDYELVHPLAKLSANDMDVLKKYAATMIGSNKADNAKLSGLAHQYLQWQRNETIKGTNPVALNGMEYIPDYKNWQPISTTGRSDNGTMRVIFGNDIAINAIQHNKINPWPDGTTFAKVAWEQLEDTAGNVQTGQFKQIEYMIKDQKRFAETKGWGWARFITPKMVPYGKTALFITECINCHLPMCDNDFVFTEPIKH